MALRRSWDAPSAAVVVALVAHLGVASAVIAAVSVALPLGVVLPAMVVDMAAHQAMAEASVAVAALVLRPAASFMSAT